MMTSMEFKNLRKNDCFKFRNAIRTKGVVYKKLSDSTYRRESGVHVFEAIAGNADFDEVVRVSGR